MTPGAVLDFWFSDAARRQWFSATPAFDADIRQRFEAGATQLAAGPFPLTAWEDTPDNALALIIVLDQFPRNMFRDTAAAFAWDARALGVAQRMVDRAFDLKIPQDRRAFVYMPFMHSENLADQDRCVALCDQRLQDGSTLHHAKEHRKVIARFGRFPHRNETLGRESTAEERSFLKSGGYDPS